MNELFSRLIAVLNAHGPDDPRVNPILDQLRAAGGENAAAVATAAQSILDDYRRGGVPQPATPPPTGMRLQWWQVVLAVLAALGVGGGAGAASGQFSWQTVRGWLDGWGGMNKPVASFGTDLERVAVIAAIGGVVGLLYAFFRDNGLVRPRLTTDPNTQRLVIGKLGFLNEVLAGGGLAVVAVWGGSLAPPPTPSGLLPLRWATVMAAAVAGLAGARMRGDWLEKGLLRRALEIVARREPLRNAAAAVIPTLSPPAAVALATGREVAGFPPPALPPPPAVTPA